LKLFLAKVFHLITKPAMGARVKHQSPLCVVGRTTNKSLVTENTNVTATANNHIC